MGRILISSGGGGGVGSDELTATKSQVLEGTAYVGADTNDEIGQGGMANQGAKTSTLNCGQSYTIPEGYHNGSGKITANSLASQTSATAAAGHILSGKTAWVNGSKVTGNIASQGALSYTPSTSAQTASVSGKYMTGNVTIGAIPSKYKDASGATISNNNQMLSGVKAIGANGTLYTGNIASMAGQTITPGTSAQTVSCSGKKMNGNIVVNAIPNTYINTSSWSVFRRGVYAGNFGLKPYLYSLEMQYGGTYGFKASGHTPCTQNFTGVDVDNSNQQCTYTGISQDIASVGWEEGEGGGSDITGYPFFNRAVDLTYYSKLYIQCWFSSYNDRTVIALIPISRKYSEEKTFGVASNRSSSFRSWTYDISALKGQYYIRLGATAYRQIALIEMTFKN